jgi:POT family proton-dependent oligopeptide transporter
VLQSQTSPLKQSAIHWVINAHLFHAIGELCLAPVFLSFVTEVAPKRVKSLLIGVYFATLGLANWLAGKIGAMSSSLGDLLVFNLILLVTVLMGGLFVIYNRKLLLLTYGSGTVKKQ